jgi:hypothetical protein
MNKCINHLYILFIHIFVFKMSLSSRWSIFSKGETAKEEEKECKKEKQQNDNGEEVVVSEKEMVVTAPNDNSEEEVKTCVESSCNAENGTECSNVDTDVLYKGVNECYFKMRTVINDGSDKNSHYSGVHTEVIPTMPVLFIEEFVPASYKFDFKKSASVTDWRAYVYYDSLRGVYVVNGTRRRNNEQGVVGTERRYPDICMTFKSRSALAFYLRRSMCSWKHSLSLTLYSMYRSVIHLSTSGAMPSFHSIHNCRSKFRSELFGYDECRVSLKEFVSYLKVLKAGVHDGYLFRPTNSVQI